MKDVDEGGSPRSEWVSSFLKISLLDFRQRVASMWALHAIVPCLLTLVLVISTVLVGLEGSSLHKTNVAHAHIGDALIAGMAAVELSRLAASQPTRAAERQSVFQEYYKSMKYKGEGIPRAEAALKRVLVTINSEDILAVTTALSEFQFQVALDVFTADPDNLLAPRYVASSLAIQSYTNARSGWDLLYSGELDGPNVRHPNQFGASRLRLHAALGRDVLCEEWFSFVKSFVEDSDGYNMCFPKVREQVNAVLELNPLEMDMGVIPPSTASDLNAFSLALLSGNANVVGRLYADHVSQDYTTGGQVRIGLLCGVIAVCIVGILVSMWLIYTQRIFLKEQADIESEFQCSASGVRMKRSAIRSLRDVTGRLSILQPALEGYGPLPSRQNSLSVRRAAEPLSMLHPFVPSYMFSTSGITFHVPQDAVQTDILRNSALIESLDEHLPSGVAGLLNLTPTVNSTADAMFLLVGLSHFNQNVSSLYDDEIQRPTGDADDEESFYGEDQRLILRESAVPQPEFDGQHITDVAASVSNLLFVVSRCVGHFGGSVVQVSHDCIVTQFVRPEEHHTEDDGVRNRWEDRACRSAFAIQKLCATQEPQLKSRMALVYGRAVIGSTTFHVSRMYTAISPALLLGLRLLPLSELYDCDIITEGGVVNRLPNRFLTRPIHMLYPVDVSVRNGGSCEPTTVFQIVLEEPDLDDEALTEADIDQVQKEQAVVKELVKGWDNVWQEYEKVMKDPKPSPQRIEHLYAMLVQFKLFRISRRDAAYELALEVVKQLASDNNVLIPVDADES